MELARKGDIADEAPLAAQKSGVLDAPDRRADAFAQNLSWRAYCSSSRSRPRRSKALRSDTTKRSASPPRAAWLANVQCGIVNTSCCDHSNVCSPTVERPSPDTTRQMALWVARRGRVVWPLLRRTAWQSSAGITASP